ncbi:Gmad2 immunoglobulin-like domain-containing protein [Terrabacter sp. 2RAF25]|uniref:Gmad2 immunoglobulin-like domain-containing protein n=1 Tax=Terrabacter sp. 2RAF25 TaxID=3232998 RepID=UPI003F97543B
MNTDPRRPGGPQPDDEPVVIGSGLRPVEDRLRRALDSEARSITPGDRLGAILTEAHAADTGSTGRHHRWLVPAVAAAAAVLLAGTVWAVNRPSGSTPPAAATSSTAGTPSASASRGTPSTGPSSVPTQTASGPTTPATTGSTPPTSAAPPVAVPTSVPVYYLGPVREGSDQVRLFREFVSAPVVAPVTPEGKALAALRLAMGPAPKGSQYVSAWTGVTPQSVTVGADSIRVRLASGTSDGATLATEQLVWTVQAALGTSLPVRFELADASPEVSPGHPASSTFNRPTDQQAVLEQVAPIWIDVPARNGVVRAGSPLTARGVASTFEADVEWELLREGVSFEKGFTTATAGAPARGTYAITTKKPLTPGAYVLRAFESSAKDGSVASEQRIPFTAR